MLPLVPSLSRLPASILIVEDEALVRFLGVGMFADAGFRVIEAADSEEAFEILAADSEVQLLFTDVNLSGTIDGLALAVQVHDRWPRIGIITTGQGTAPAKGPNANLSVNITPENRTRIHDVFVKERSAPRVDHVAFGLSVGTAVPRSVHIVAVPQTIIEIQPTWRGYEYFMVGDQIVIVDPRSMEIVAVLDA